MSVCVLRPGLFSTLQDLGRYGHQHLGIVPCGAMDPVSHAMANALVGNDEGEATLECTVVGPELRFEQDALVALYGAACEGRGARLPANRPVLVPAGETVSIGTAVRGTRAYLAVAGGFRVPPVLGSRSTYAPAGFGGLAGRALRSGDRLPTVEPLAELSAERFSRLSGVLARGRLRTVRWSVPELTLPRAGTLLVRAMEGRHRAQFDAASQAAFFSHEWRVSPSSDRIGYRLEGPRLQRAKPLDVLSEPTCLGTVQVPNDGCPIVLMADHQTTGGYPKIAELASADMPQLAQLPAGARVRFLACSVEEAQHAEDRQLELLAGLRRAVQDRYSQE
ncbi:MAG TPA: biotin-dependent carboxyltransferase family protein [Burkholderiales bacterium]